MTCTTQPISAIILSGGKSTRMGKDKGMLQYKGKPFLQWLIDTVNPLAQETMIISNHAEHHQFGHRVYSDLFQDMGPLAGIYTGLHYAQFQTNIILSCDIPLISKNVLHFLLKMHDNNHITLPFCNDKIHYLIGIYQKSYAQFFLNELKNNQKKVKSAVEKLPLSIVGNSNFERKNFLNINTPSDLKKLQP